MKQIREQSVRKQYTFLSITVGYCKELDSSVRCMSAWGILSKGYQQSRNLNTTCFSNFLLLAKLSLAQKVTSFESTSSTLSNKGYSYGQQPTKRSNHVKFLPLGKKRVSNKIQVSLVRERKQELFCPHVFSPSPEGMRSLFYIRMFFKHKPKFGCFIPS